MFNYKFSKYFILKQAALFILLPMLVSCNSNLTNSTNANVSTVNGRIGEPLPSQSGSQSSSSTNLGGATVRLNLLRNDGSLEDISNQSVQTKSNGSFQITTNRSGIRNTIITVKQNGTTFKSVISDAIHHGIIITSPPVTRETTAKTNTYLDAEAQLNGSVDTVHYSDIQSLMNIRTSRKIYGDSTSVEILAHGIIQWTSAHKLAFKSSIIGASDKQLKNIAQSKAVVTAQLQRALYNAGTDTNAIIGAYNAYYQGVFSAYVNNGISLTQMIEGNETANTALINNTSNIKQGIQFTLEQNGTGVLSSAIGLVDKTALNNLGAKTATVDSALSAVNHFQTQLTKATSEDSLKASITSYHDSVIKIMEEVLTQNATGIADVDDSINSQNGLKAQLKTSLRNQTSPQMIVQTYAAYFDAIDKLMKNKSGISNSSTLQAATKLMIVNNIY